MHEQYLSWFIDDVRRDLAVETHVDPEQAIFIDFSGKSAGDDWAEEIGRALANASVCVALYSPQYFDVGDDDCYCGKEFQAFRDRLKATTGDWAFAHILPVLWTTSRSLREHKPQLPPPPIRDLDYQLTAPDATPAQRRHYETYNRVGLLDVLRGTTRRTVWPTIRTRIRDRIIELMEPALDPANEHVRFADTACAFHDDCDGARLPPSISDLQPIAQGGAGAVAIILCADQELPAELRSVWRVIDEAARREQLDVTAVVYSSTDGFDVLDSKVAEITRSNQLALLVIDDDSLSTSYATDVSNLVGAQNRNVAVVIVTSEAPLPFAGRQNVHRFSPSALGGDLDEHWPHSEATAIASLLLHMRAEVTNRAEAPAALQDQSPLPRI